MTKNISRIFALIGISALCACTGNYEEYNTDPYAVTAEEMERDGYSVKAALVNLGSAVISTDVNTTQFTECLLGGTQGGYMADAGAFSNTISNYNATDNWTNVFFSSDKFIPIIYPNYQLLQTVTDDEVILAVADVIRVAAMHRITDTYGPIPYSQIGADGSLTVAYDSMEDIYNQMFEELDADIDVLLENVTNNFTSSADPVYGGVVENWIKYANSLKLRLAMRVVYADESLAKEMAESAVDEERGGVMTSNDDNATFASYGTDGNPINVSVEYNMVSTHSDGTSCTTESGDSHVAADIIAYMNGYNDPRREAYFTEGEWDGYDYVGMRRGIDIPDHSTYGHKYSGFNIGTTDPLVWMNAAEVAFLEAEAVAVFGFDMGVTAQEAYETGIQLSFDQWGVSGADDYIADDTSVPELYTDPRGADSYSDVISTITIAWDESATTEEKQERIITQKWIANWLLGCEAWADWRRTGYPYLMPVVSNKSNGVVDSAHGLRRMPYPASEAVSNGTNYAYAVSTLLGGTDNYNTRLWFDCKSNNPNYN